MSYSRWGGRGSGRWYTYWGLAKDEKLENRDTALFCIQGVANLSAQDLRENLYKCLSIVRQADLDGDINELKEYIKEFLDDVDSVYPPPPSIKRLKIRTIRCL